METDPSEETLLARWLAGELDETEVKALENHPEFPEWKRLAELSENLSPPPFDANASWDQFADQIKTAPNPETEKNSGKPDMEKSRISAKIWVPVATFLVAAGIALFLVFGLNSPPNYTTLPGEIISVTLPDGSLVTLDPDSELSFNEKNWEEDRSVTLKGDAYFNVQKGSKFEVKSKSGSVEVLGTQFQVRDRDRSYFVWCLSGKVGVSFEESSEKTILTPNLAVMQEGTNSPQPFEFISADFIANARSTFRYQDADYGQVILDFERHFGITVETPPLTGRSYSGAFFRNDLERSLKLLTEPMGLTYEKTGPQKYRFLQPNS